MTAVPSASYSLTIRVQTPHAAGAVAAVAGVIGDEGGHLGAIDLVRVEQDAVTRDLTVACVDQAHGEAIEAALRELDGIEVVHVSDRTFLLHVGGKIEMQSKVPIKTRDDLSMIYTPGVARVCLAIHEHPEDAWTLTSKRNTVAVVTDGTAVLGLGDIGPEAAMPVMEGKAALFKEFAGVDAWPLCLSVTDVDEVVAVVKAVAPGFGGINLEDISAPRCFEIERRLQQELDIPVFHDDQHGTAVVVLAALQNALKLVGKHKEHIRVVGIGPGAAGIAVSDMLLAWGVRDVIGFDRRGPLHRGRTDLDAARSAFAARTNPHGFTGTLDEALTEADVVIGLSGPGSFSRQQVARMADDAIVFAMANPTPELMPEDAPENVAVMATGRSDYPNQINNVLAFPGIFRGALDVRAERVNEAMKLAAAQAIADVIPEGELLSDYVIPSVFNRRVAEAVARAVAEAAIATGVARRTTLPESETD